MARFAVILPAAGQSRRFSKQGQKKVFQSLEGRPVWLRSADLFLNRTDVVQVVVVVAPDDQQYFVDRFGSDLAVLGMDWVLGGTERCHSVANALKKIRQDVDCIAIHDAARPCVSDEEIDQVFAAAAKEGAAILATRLASTIKRGKSQVEQTVDRTDLWAAQTPQVFRADWLRAAYDQLGDGSQVTDDSQLMEQAGHPVQIVEGKSTNLKITTAEDLKLASAIVKARPRNLDSLFHPFKD